MPLSANCCGGFAAHHSRDPHHPFIITIIFLPPTIIWFFFSLFLRRRCRCFSLFRRRLSSSWIPSASPTLSPTTSAGTPRASQRCSSPRGRPSLPRLRPRRRWSQPGLWTPFQDWCAAGWPFSLVLSAFRSLFRDSCNNLATTSPLLIAAASAPLLPTSILFPSCVTTLSRSSPAGRFHLCQRREGQHNSGHHLLLRPLRPGRRPPGAGGHHPRCAPRADVAVALDVGPPGAS